jgi:hypothetical protein
MPEAIDRDHVGGVLRVLEVHAHRGGSLVELVEREVVGRAPNEGQDARDARPRRKDPGIDVAVGDAREDHRRARVQA